MPAYCFFDLVEMKDPAKMETYRQGVLATVQKYDGRYLTVGGQCDLVEGSWKPAYPVIIEFPSLQQAHRWYDSPEYKDLKALRLAATRCNAVFIDGVPFAS